MIDPPHAYLATKQSHVVVQRRKIQRSKYPYLELEGYGQGLRAEWSKSPVCVFICYTTRLGKGQISHPGTAVFVCFLLAWWMDQK